MILSLLLCGNAWAGAPSALGVPNSGGAFGGPTQPGAYGLHFTPTAAKSESAEILLDTATFINFLTIDLDGIDPVSTSGVTPLPYLAATVPWGPVGFGFQVGVPFGRTGDNPPDSPFRMFTLEGGLIFVESRLSVAVEATEKFTFGAGLRYGYSILNGSVGMDTGALMHQLLGPPADELIGDPLMEGNRVIKNGGGWGHGFSLGFQYKPIERVIFAVAYNSAVATPLTGDMEITPSRDLNLVVKADLVGFWVYPEEFHVGLSLPVGPVDVHAHAEYIAWGESSSTLSNLNDAYVESEDPVLSGILAAYGLDDPAALGSFENIGNQGMQNILTGGLHVSWKANDTWTYLAGMSYAPAAIRPEWVSPANIDFEGFDFRVGAKWTPKPHIEWGFSLDVWKMPMRDITDSIADPMNPAGLPNTPSGNGDYYSQSNRIGISAKYSF